MLNHTDDTKVYVNRITAHKIAVSLAWTAGLVCGVLTVATTGATLPGNVLSRGPFPSLIAILTFPLLLSTLLITINKAILIIPLIFIKAFSFGLTASVLTYTYGSAGWLIRLLTLFSAFLSAVLLLLFIYRNSSKQDTLYSDSILFALINILIGIADYYIISPILINSLY